MKYRAKVKEIEFPDSDGYKYIIPSEICTFLGKDETVYSSKRYLLEFHNKGRDRLSVSQEYLDKYFEPIEDNEYVNKNLINGLKRAIEIAWSGISNSEKLTVLYTQELLRLEKLLEEN